MINKESIKSSKFFKLETYKNFTKNHIIIPFKKSPIITSAICCIILSTLLLFILLVGTPQSIYLSKFTFDEPIQALIKKQQISFTLYSHCVDNICSDPSFKHDFDQIPSVEEIAGDIGNLFKKRFDPNEVKKGIEDQAGDITDKVGEVGKNVGDKVTDTAEEIIKKAKEILPTMLDGIKNFKPQVSTVNFVGLFAVPYLVALLMNIIMFVLLYFGLNVFVIILLLLSAFFNALSLIFDTLLFVWVFQVIALIPGLGQQHTGPGIHLAVWSLIFLITATILMMIGVCCGRKKISPSNEKNQETSKISNNV